MKKIFAALIAFAVTASMVLTGCNGGGNPQNSGAPSDTAAPGPVEIKEGSFSADGKYTPAKGDNYIGIRLEIERDSNKGSWEFYMICQGDIIADCGVNEYIPRYRKIEFLGKPYWDGVRDFIGIVKSEPGVTIKGVGAAITENEDFENYRANFHESVREHLGEVKYDSSRETVDRFEEYVRISCESYDHGEWKALADGEGGGNPGPGPEGQDNDPNSPKTINSYDELITAYKAGTVNFKLTQEITIDLGREQCYGIMIDCNGQHVNITGEVNGANVKELGELIVLENASSVDMSKLNVSLETFNKEDFVKRSVQIVFIRNTSYKTVIKPESVATNTDQRDISPLEGYLEFGINDDGDQMNLEFRGPEFTYEERREYEAKLVKAVLTKGDTKSVSEDPKHREDCLVWTDVTVNVGNAKLPNQNYQEIIIKKGGKLTVKGTITVTGGTLSIEIKTKDGNCLDLTGLKLTKKHPSPDMCKIRFPKGTKINEKKFKPKATSGKIKFSKGETEFMITIW